MKFTANYEVTEAMQDASIHGYYVHVLLLPRAWRYAAMLVILILMIVLLPTYRSWAVVFAIAALSVLTLFWAKAYFQMRRQGRAGLEVMEHPRIEITMDDDGISYLSSTGTRHHLWNKIRRIVESRDFVFLMNQTLPLLSLPKSAFSEEALAFMRQKSWIERKD